LCDTVWVKFTLKMLSRLRDSCLPSLLRHDLYAMKYGNNCILIHLWYKYLLNPIQFILFLKYKILKHFIKKLFRKLILRKVRFTVKRWQSI